jgi:copper chaperone CopZ
MTIEEKIELNKKIKKYEGTNQFVISLQKQLKTSKYLTKEDFKGKSVKVLSEKQYDAAKSSME